MTVLHVRCFLLSCLLFCCSGSTVWAETVLHLGSPWAPKTLDIQKSGYVFIRLGVTEGLVDVDENLNLVPALASAWTVSPDHLTWTFTIRPGVEFHDGSPVTATIVKDCLKRLLNSGTLLKTVPITAIEAPDDATVVVTTSQPFAPLAAYLSRGEAAIVAPSSYDAAGTLVKPVGTGPFVFDSWKVKEEVVTTANPSHWSGKRAKVDKVVYKAVPEAMTRLSMLRSGELDIAQIMPADAAKSLADDGDFHMQTKEIGRTRFITYNSTRAPFDDLKARQAFSLAVDRKAIVDHLLDGIGQPASGLYPPGLFWADETIAASPFDPDAAKKLLEEAGWKDADGDGIRERNEKPFSITLLTYPERAELPLIAEAIQDQLGKIGIKVELVVLPVEAAQETRSQGDFDLYLVGRGLLFVPDPDENLMLDYSSQGVGKESLGAFNWKNPKVDFYLAQARIEFNRNKRKELYNKVQHILTENLPVCYLNYYVNVDLLSAKVDGYRMHPVEQSFHLETVELKK